MVRDFGGIRQVLTPSRLADVRALFGVDGFVVAVHAVQSPPERDSATGLYAVPQGEAALRIVVAREEGGRRVSVTVRKGGGDARTHVFECMGGCWSLMRASGVSVSRRRVVEDERAAQIVRSTRSPSGALLARRVKNYAWMPWDAFAMTNRVDGFDGMTETTVWTYYADGGSKGLVHTERRQSGLQIAYVYDPEGRVVSETRSGPGMMTETTTCSYAPLAEEDVPRGVVDARPRTVVKTVGGVEAERTYFLYAELSNVVERAASPGAAYGAAGALRTVTTFFPEFTTWGGGRVRRIRREDGRVDEYGYSMEGDVWTEKVTHLHESADAPVEGRTTRDFTLTNERGETVETRTEAYAGGEWRVVARELRTHDAQGRVVRPENLAGQATTTEWDCCHKISETDPDGSITTWEYDEDDRMVASSRLIPIDMTEVAWLTTCHEYDGLGR